VALVAQPNHDSRHYSLSGSLPLYRARLSTPPRRLAASHRFAFASRPSTALRNDFRPADPLTRPFTYIHTYTLQTPHTPTSLAGTTTCAPTTAHPTTHALPPFPRQLFSTLPNFFRFIQQPVSKRSRMPLPRRSRGHPDVALSPRWHRIYASGIAACQSPTLPPVVGLSPCGFLLWAPWSRDA
jgi:hypothetical protein